MRFSRMIWTCVTVGVAAFTVAAQEKPGAIAGVEFQKPKPGMTQQYEEGRKQKAAWHKEQKDPQALYVWEIISGDRAGTFIVGRLGNHWKDYDNPPISDKADTAEFAKTVMPYTESVVPRYYEYLPDVSRPAQSGEPSAMSVILTFHVRFGRGAEFIHLIGMVHDALVKTNRPGNDEWYELDNGGRSGEFVLSLPRSKWAEFEPQGPGIRKLLEDAYGREGADSFYERMDRDVTFLETEIFRFRADLSYLPAK
jgi:hypothetical protein